MIMESGGAGAVGRLKWIQVDARDPVALAQFWAELLGTTVRGQLGDPAHYVVLEATPDVGVRMAFQRVPDPAAGKNRLHVDLAVEDVEAATRRVTALGGRVVADHAEYDLTWRVVADPEGNQFCLVPE